MHTEFRYGRLKYISFVLIDIVCLIFANLFSFYVYAGLAHLPYSYERHFNVMLAMIAIDAGVTIAFSTLRRVLRWKKKRELYESGRHVLISLAVLTGYLFCTKHGKDYSRAIILTTYAIDYCLIWFFRTAWRYLLLKLRRKPEHPTVLLLTTDGFAQDGIESLREIGCDIKYLYLLKNLQKKEIDGIPVIEDIKEAASVLCWDVIDRVYIFGLDHQMVPDYLVRACKEMNLEFELVDFNFRVIDVKTIQNRDPKLGALSFLEGKRDIPFPIRRVYWITETEADLHRGFHAHKLNCQLLYCPYGCIDIILDDGENKTTVTLDKPGKGLILMPGLWREMVWRQSGSVLCVLASEYYDEQEYIRDYNEFLAYCRKYRESAAKRSRTNRMLTERLQHCNWTM